MHSGPGLREKWASLNSNSFPQPQRGGECDAPSSSPSPRRLCWAFLVRELTEPAQLGARSEKSRLGYYHSAGHDPTLRVTWKSTEPGVRVEVSLGVGAAGEQIQPNASATALS